MARSGLNKEAGAWLRAVRERKSKKSAPRFAELLSREVGLKVTAKALYAYETGVRTVPAALLLAASELVKEPIAPSAEVRKVFLEEVVDFVMERIREEDRASRSTGLVPPKPAQ